MFSMFSLKSWKVWAVLGFLTVSFVSGGYSKTMEEDMKATPTKKLCSSCEYCDKRCVDYPETSDDYRTCTLAQLFCCGRYDKCSPFSLRKIPPWGWGLISLGSSTVLACSALWICVGRPNIFRKCHDYLISLWNKRRGLIHPLRDLPNDDEIRHARSNDSNTSLDLYDIIQVRVVAAQASEAVVYHGDFVQNPEGNNGIPGEDPFAFLLFMRTRGRGTIRGQGT